MSATTSIEWTDRTWNPVTGCTKVSAGCKHCYAETVAKRLWATQYSEVNLSGKSLDGYPLHKAEELVMDGLTRKRRFTDVWTHPDRLDEPLRWRKPQRIFVNSMSDLFHEDVPEEFIDQVFAVMALVSQHGRDEHHTMQVLTKRPERARDYLSDARTSDRVFAVTKRFAYPLTRADTEEERAGCQLAVSKGTFWPLPNVWLGVSVENQETADERIPLLPQTPAAVRFLSVEPLLGAVDLRRLPLGGADELDALTGEVIAGRTGCVAEELPPVDWVIVGGESGPGARPCDLRWVRSVVAQCRDAGVPCFVKQLGAKPIREVEGPHEDDVLWNIGINRKGGDIHEWPLDLRVREWPEVRA